MKGHPILSAIGVFIGANIVMAIGSIMINKVRDHDPTKDGFDGPDKALMIVDTVVPFVAAYMAYKRFK